MTRQIGTLAEKSLHAALKLAYALPGDQLEYPLAGSVIDIVRRDHDAAPTLCIEIQTRNLGALKPKLRALLDDHSVRVVHPIARERTITRIDADGVIVSKRKSPRHGTVYHVFPELVGITPYLLHPQFTLEIALIREEQVWVDDGRGSWRRKRWSIHDRKLIAIDTTITLATFADYVALLPPDLPPAFDTLELARAIKTARPLAQKMAYCLRAIGVIQMMGKRGNAVIYARLDAHEIR